LAYVHEDRQLLPKLPQVWAAWNYTCEVLNEKGGDDSPSVCVHYLIDKLQPIPNKKSQNPVIVSLNPQLMPASDKTHCLIKYAHPVFNQSESLLNKNYSKFKASITPIFVALGLPMVFMKMVFSQAWQLQIRSWNQWLPYEPSSRTFDSLW